jgi:pimeloyl-ACP methyl ester carboxylesterase
LITYGTRDPLSPERLALALHAAIPGSRLERIPGGGHYSVMEYPELFARHINAFLANLPDPVASP